MPRNTARWSRRLLLSVFLGAAALHPLSAIAQQPQQGSAPAAPASQNGEWWNDPAVQKELTLTTAQTKKIDDIYARFQASMRTVEAELTKRQQEFDKMVQEHKVDDKTIEAQATILVALRAPLSVNRIVMTYRIYGVLTPAQNQSLRAILAKRRAARSGQPDQKR